MSINEMEKKIAALKEWEELLEEAKAQVESLAALGYGLLATQKNTRKY